MPFDLRQLEIFSAIVRAGSLGRAAADLNLTQPALSRAIQRLEQTAGAPLFERHSRGMKLTDIGEALWPRAALIEAEARQARDDIDALRGLSRGTVRVGAVASIACLVLPQAIKRLLEVSPGLRIQVIEGVWDRLADALSHHEIDLALGVDAPDTDAIVAIRDCVWQDRSFIVAAAAHPLRRAAAIRLDDTLSERWASLPPGTGPYEHLESVFADHGFGLPNIIVETRSITVLKSLVMDAGFLGWMAQPMYQAEQRAGAIEPLPIAGVERTRRLTAFRRRRGILPGPSVRLLDELRKLAATVA